jgi:hypothetical protein
MGVLLSSPVNYIEAAVAVHFSYATAMAAVAASVFALAIFASAIGPERRGQEFGKP